MAVELGEKAMEKRNSDRRHVYTGIFLPGILLVLTSASTGGSEPAEPTAQNSQTTGATSPNEITVALKEMPLWEVTNPRVRDSFLRGQVTVVQKARPAQGKYPTFKSDAPLYGNILFGGPDWRRSFRFALDDSQTGSGYDLLYFDENEDLDLTNDKPRKPAPQSELLARRSSGVQETYFEPVPVTFDFGSAGRQTLELLTYLRVYEGSTAQCSFVAARVHTGEFQTDGTSYQAFLGYRFSIRGPLDQSSAGLILVPPGGQPASWWGGDELNATHLLGGRYYRFSCTPPGDKLSVRPYEGPLGILEVGAGGRTVENVVMRGSLRSKDSAVAVGEGLKDGWPQSARQCRIPVGDYYPTVLYVDLGHLRIMVSNNYHTNAQGQPSLRAPVHGIAVRADKPYVLDFSHKPAVVFTEPAAGRPIKPGDAIRVKAVLIDPVLDVMVRRLNVTAPTSMGTAAAGPPVSLDPKVTIARANGEIVAEGVMPFG
jgi:hypothetical protein